MLREITFEQFLEWVAYAELEPFGERREDFRAASVARAVWDAMRWSQSTREHPFKPTELDAYRLKFGEEDGPPKQRTQTWQEQLAIAHQWVNAFNTQAK